MTSVEAVIVAGGLGTRLRPLTVNAPKHLLPVAGVPFVVHQVAKLAAAGVRRVVLATSYHAEQFQPILGDGQPWGVELVYVREAEPLGTAGAIRNVADHLDSASDDPVVIVNGDILSGHDLPAQIDRHRAERADVTLHLVEVPDARAYGCVPTRAGWVTAFLEKSPDPISHQINAGCYVFARSIVDAIPAGRVVSVERETFPALLEGGRRVLGHVDRSYWIDVGTPAALVQASSDLVRGVAASPAYQQRPAESFVDQASVHPTAAVRGGSAIGVDAVVGEGAVVDNSVVAPGAEVREWAVVVDSVLGPGSRVGARCVVRDSVVGDAADVGERCELLAGARIGVGAVLAAGAVRFSPDD